MLSFLALGQANDQPRPQQGFVARAYLLAHQPRVFDRMEQIVLPLAFNNRVEHDVLLAITPSDLDEISSW